MLISESHRSRNIICIMKARKFLKRNNRGYPIAYQREVVEQAPAKKINTITYANSLPKK